MNTKDDLLLRRAAAQAIDLSPPLPPPEGQQVQQGIPIQAVIAMVDCRILSPRQGFQAIFNGVTPTEWDEVGVKAGRR